MIRNVLFFAAVGLLTLPAHADIYEWEWIDPNDPSLGKRESTTLVPDGAGVDAQPGENLANLDLTMAYFIEGNLSSTYFSEAMLFSADFSGANLSNSWFVDATLSKADFSSANLSNSQLGRANLTESDFTEAALSNAILHESTLNNANFINANLTNAYFGMARLNDAVFTGAFVHGANFSNTTSRGFTAAQLYSTASYQSAELTGIQLWGNDLSGWNFSGQNLTDAYFSSAKLTDSDFTNAVVRGASFYQANANGFTDSQLYSTASYQVGDLTGVVLWYSDLTAWSFAGQNVTSANFYQSTLTNTNFTNAVVKYADFSRRFDTVGLADWQLYSTASYKLGDLEGIRLSKNDLTGWKFAGQNLINSYFFDSTLADADFTGADTRGAVAMNIQPTTITRNLIRQNGTIPNGLHVDPDETMRLWDYDGETPIPIVVEDGMSIDPTGTLRAVFEDDDWGSTIAFEAGIDVMLGGTLLLEFDDDVNIADQWGRTIALFDWTGVSPAGTFNVQSPYGWDLSELYTTGEVTLVDIPMLPADFDADNDVDGADFLTWQGNPSAFELSHWQANYGGNLNAGSASSKSIPEPTTVVLLALGLLFPRCNQRRSHSSLATSAASDLHRHARQQA